MRTAFDLTPLWRSGIGFDYMRDLLDGFARVAPADNYPPYNIEKTGEDAYRVTLAVAGFASDELAISAEPNRLTITGRKADGEARHYLHRGIATRSFERQFALVDHIRVTGTSLEQGLLRIELVRDVPEAMRPRRIPIAIGKSSQVAERREAA